VDNSSGILKSNILSDSVSELFWELSLLASIFNDIDDISDQLNFLKWNVFVVVFVGFINSGGLESALFMVWVISTKVFIMPNSCLSFSSETDHV
jgi:hypothetical protein